MSGKPDQYDDLGVFVAEQEAFRRIVAESRLPHVEVDTTSGVAGAADRIADWLEVTGGLFMP